jgi:hypothetical protein
LYAAEAIAWAHKYSEHLGEANGLCGFNDTLHEQDITRGKLQKVVEQEPDPSQG